MVLRTVLVVHDGSVAGDAVLQAGFDNVEAHGGRVVVLTTTAVHRSLRITNLPAVFDEPGWETLARAEAVARERGLEIDVRLRRTHDEALAILHEAGLVQPDAIFMPLRRSRLSWLPQLRGTVRTILREAPCPVILGYLPSRSQLEVAGALAEAQRVLSVVP